MSRAGPDGQYAGRHCESQCRPKVNVPTISRACPEPPLVRHRPLGILTSWSGNTDRSQGRGPHPCDLSVFSEHAVGMPSGLCRIRGGSGQAWDIVGTLTFRGTLTFATLTSGTMPFGTLALGHARGVDVRETASGTPTFGTLSFGTLYFRTLTIGSMTVGNHPSVLVLGVWYDRT